jgi:hypothetical protein
MRDSVLTERLPKKPVEPGKTRARCGRFSEKPDGSFEASQPVFYYKKSVHLVNPRFHPNATHCHAGVQAEIRRRFVA